MLRVEMARSILSKSKLTLKSESPTDHQRLSFCGTTYDIILY